MPSAPISNKKTTDAMPLPSFLSHFSFQQYQQLKSKSAAHFGQDIAYGEAGFRFAPINMSIRCS